MKHYLTTAALSLIFCVAFAKENEKRVKSDIKEVTIFLNGAQVTNTATVNLNPGTTELVFEDLSQYVWDNNIQARGDGDFTILSVVKKMNYMNDEVPTKDVKTLQDSLESISDRVEYFNSLWNIYQQEEEMLKANKSIGGQNNGVNVAELEKAANLLRTRMIELEGKKMENSRKVKKLKEQQTKINQQLAELNAKMKKVTSEITVSVASKTAMTAKIYLSYIIQNAGWAPFYDIRAIDNASPIKLEYKAHVWQNSGYDWEGVKLTLSTSNPYQSGTKPTLGVWWVNTYDPYVYKTTYHKNKSAAYGYGAPAPTSVESNDVYLSKQDSQKSNNTSANYTTVSENQVNTTFDIAIPYNIPTDNKQYAVDIQNYTMPAMYRYYCAPKIDRDAFLIAKITGWDSYNLLSGEANIFYEGMYVGKSEIDTENTSDTLDISLGRDKNVVVTRTKLKEFCEKKIIGLNRKETMTFEIAVRNKKKQDIEIDIEDQIPVSQNKELEVELLESSSAKVDATTGKLTWSIKMKAGDNTKMKLSFSAKYPKDKVITNLN